MWEPVGVLPVFQSLRRVLWLWVLLFLPPLVVASIAPDLFLWVISSNGDWVYALVVFGVWCQWDYRCYKNEC